MLKKSVVDHLCGPPKKLNEFLYITSSIPTQARQLFLGLGYLVDSRFQYLHADVGNIRNTTPQGGARGIVKISAKPGRAWLSRNQSQGS